MTTNTFYIDFGVTGAKRKRLVDIISTFAQADKKYLGAPSFAYQVDYFTIDKNGVVSFDSRADSEEIEGLLEILAYEGFIALTSDYGLESEEESEQDESSDTGETVGLTVAIPLEKVNVDNLKNLLEAKGELIKHALSINSTAIEITENSVKFPWFETMPDADTVKAVTLFISSLCKMSKEQKRINKTEKAVDNEKYAFRCFLLRLGFIGDEYKAERKILLRNLQGSAAFKSPVTEKTYKVELDNDQFKIFTAKNNREAQSVAFEIAKENNSEFCEVSEVAE